MDHEEVKRISRELEELLDMQDGETKNLPAADALLKAQREYSSLMEGDSFYEAKKEPLPEEQLEEPYPEDEFEDEVLNGFPEEE